MRRTDEPELFEGDFWSDPYPAYAALRAAEPVRRVELPDGPVWLLTRYADVRAALTDPRFSKDWRYTLPPEARPADPALPMPMMILMDPPDHTRLRSLVGRAFTARRVAALRPRIEQIAAELLGDLPHDGPVDLVARYAFPLPVQVICELLGVPAEDRDSFGAWSTTMVDDSPAQAKDAASAQLAGYLGALVARRRAEPDDALLSSLIAIADGGDRLSAEELVAMAMMLLIAGHETTTNLIGNGVLALLTHPEQRELGRRPERMPAAVEELLRWDSPVHNAPVRFAAEDVEVAGTTIPAGAVVQLSLGAANRDPDRFSAAEELRLDRDASGHVAFGHGVHFCLGAQLARIEGEIAIGRLLAAYPRLRLAVDPTELVHRRSTLVRGLTALPVLLT